MKWTPLHFATRHQGEEVVKMLLEAGANVNAEDDTKWTPLMLASYAGQPDNLKLLLASEANINAETDEESVISP